MADACYSAKGMPTSGVPAVLPFVEPFRGGDARAISIDRSHVTGSSARARRKRTGAVKELQNAKGRSLMGGGATVAWVDARLMGERSGVVVAGPKEG